MKYLAILKDSLREALDSKVLYVMMGLSCLLILLTLSLSFKPRESKDFWQAAALPLNGDLSDLSHEALERMMRQMEQEGITKAYEVVGAQPLDGAPAGPRSPYVVTLRERSKEVAKAQQVRAFPQATEQQIKERFGNIGGLKIVQATGVRLARADNPLVPEERDAHDVYFEVTTQPAEGTLRWWPHEISLFFGALPLGGGVPLGLQLFVVLNYVVNTFGAWVTLLVSVIITAFFIPGMLRRGTIDLLLAKPVHRSTLLIYKYIGGLLFVFLNTTVAVVGMWLAFGLRSGIWVNHFLLTVFVITFFFAILYAVSTCFAVLTRSAIAALLVTCAFWFGMFVVGKVYQVFDTRQKEEVRHNIPEGERWGHSKFGTAISVVHFVLPRTKDLDLLMERFLISDLLMANQVNLAKVDPTSISWGESLTASGVFIALMLGLSCVIFAIRDY